MSHSLWIGYQESDNKELKFEKQLDNWWICNNFIPIKFQERENNDHTLVLDQGISGPLYLTHDGAYWDGKRYARGSFQTPTPTPTPNSTSSFNQIITPECFVDNGKQFFLKSALGNAYLHVYGGQAYNGAKLTTWEYVDQPNLKWTLTSTNNGYYINSVVNGNFVIHLHGGGNNNGDHCTLWDKTTHGQQDNLKIKFKRTHDNYWNLVFNNSGKCAHVHGASIVNGTPITQWDGVDQPNLKWVFIPVESPIQPQTQNGNIFNGQRTPIRFISNKGYTIQNSGNSLALDVPESRMDNEVKIIQYPLHGGSNQRWIFDEQSEDGSYIIKNVCSGKVLDVYGSSQESGTKLQQFQQHGGDNQRWFVISQGDGSVMIQSKVNKLVLDVPKGTQAHKAKIILFKSHGGTNQRWIIRA